MNIRVRTYGLLGGLLRKSVPQEVVLEKTSPITVREILEEVGISGEDLLFVAVTVNGAFVKKTEIDLSLECESIEIALYPVFAGG
jgi:sulfur carrier protein ThiS